MKQRLRDHSRPRRIKAKHQHVASLEAEMLRRVRARGGLSRVELARELKLAPSTAGIYVDRLVREGFLLESATAERKTAGRPLTLLVPNPDGGRFIGVDLEARQPDGHDRGFLAAAVAAGSADGPAHRLRGANPRQDRTGDRRDDRRAIGGRCSASAWACRGSLTP